MRVYLILLLLPLFIACSETATSSSQTTAGTANVGSATLEPSDIEVTITGAPAGKVILVGQYTDQQFQGDTAVADANGYVRFKRENPLQPGFYFAYFTDGSAAQMLVDADQTFSLKTNKNDIAGEMQVEGSVDNKLLYDGLNFETSLSPEFSSVTSRLQGVSPGQPIYTSLQAERKALIDRRTGYYAKIFADHPNSLFTKYKQAGQNPDVRTITDAAGNADEAAQVTAFRYDFWNDVDFNDVRLLRTPVISNKLTRYIKELTPQNADSIIKASDFLLSKVLTNDEYYQYFANWITLQYEPGKTAVMDGEAIHVHMIRNYFTKDRAFWADSMTVYGLQQRADQMAQSLVGQAGPDITVPDVNGKPRRLYDEKAQYVLVYMYNPDCEHCIEETPRLVNWYKKNKNRASVYAIALDTEPAKWKSFIGQYGLQEFTNVYDPTNRSIFKTFYVDNTPELYILDKDRKIVAKNIKPGQLDQAIDLVEGK